MKKTLIIVLAIIAVSFSCNNMNSEVKAGNNDIASEVHEQPATSSTPDTPVETPEKLDKAKFLAEIMDYETNPAEWNYKGELPGLIDFYADWCRPCKITSPILDELAQEYAGKIKIYKVDVQKEQELASVFGVQSIPTFLFIPKEGKPTISSGIAQTPEQTKEMFKQQIETLLLKTE